MEWSPKPAPTSSLSGEGGDETNDAATAENEGGVNASSCPWPSAVGELKKGRHACPARRDKQKGGGSDSPGSEERDPRKCGPGKDPGPRPFGRRAVTCVTPFWRVCFPRVSRAGVCVSGHVPFARPRTTHTATAPRTIRPGFTTTADAPSLEARFLFRIWSCATHDSTKRTVCSPTRVTSSVPLIADPRVERPRPSRRTKRGKARVEGLAWEGPKAGKNRKKRCNHLQHR